MNTEKFRIPQLDRDIPGQRNHAEQNDAGNPQVARDQPVVALAAAKITTITAARNGATGPLASMASPMKI